MSKSRILTFANILDFQYLETIFFLISHFTFSGNGVIFSIEHEPIHVHGKFQGNESKAEILIEDGKVKEVFIKSVKGRKPLPITVLKNFKKFVELYADEIVEKWIDYFVLHKQVSCESIKRKIQ